MPSAGLVEATVDLEGEGCDCGGDSERWHHPWPIYYTPQETNGNASFGLLPGGLGDRALEKDAFPICIRAS